MFVGNPVGGRRGRRMRPANANYRRQMKGLATILCLFGYLMTRYLCFDFDFEFV